MAGPPAAESAVHPRHDPAVDALRAAQVWWVTFLATPLVALAVGWWALAGQGAPTERAIGVWLAVTAMVWLLVAGPAVFVLRGHCFRAAWTGRPISPRRYLRGVVSTWAVLEVGALSAVVSCLVGHALLPGAAVLAVALATLALLPPSARALAR